MTGIKVDIIVDRSKVRPNDAPCNIADVTKIENEIGWKAEIELEETLRGLLDYWRVQL